MRAKRRLCNRVLSFALACIMLCSLFMVDGIIPQAHAASPTTVQERLDWIALRACYQRPHETYRYHITVGLSIVGDNGKVAASADNVEFDVEFTDMTTATISNASADVNCKNVGGISGKDEILTFYGMYPRDTLRRLCLDAQAAYMNNTTGARFNTNPGFDRIFQDDPSRDMSHAAFMGQGGSSDFCKYFVKTVSAQLLSVTPGVASDLGSSWNSEMNVTMTYHMDVWSKNALSVTPADAIIKKTNKEIPDLSNLRSAGLTITGTWDVSSAIQVDLISQYESHVNPGNSNIDASAQLWNKYLFRLYTQSSIFSDPDSKTPSRDDKFKPMMGLDGWDGFIPYRAVIKGLNTAYNGLPGCQDAVKQMFSKGVSLEAAKSFEAEYNAEQIGEATKIHAADHAPGLFYQIMINGLSPDYSEDPSDLVRNISGSYNAATDEYTINYELRSTYNSVYFMFFPVQRVGNKISTIFDLNGGYNPPNLGERYKSDIFEKVDVTVSVMKLPEKALDALTRLKKSPSFGCYYRGNGYSQVTERDYRPDYEQGLFLNQSRYYATDCCGAGKVGPTVTTNSSGPTASAQIGANFRLPGSSGEYDFNDAETMGKLFAQDASTPKLTWSGTMMFGEGGYPDISVSLWDGLSPTNTTVDPGAGTVILDWNMSGFPAGELQKGDTAASAIEIVSQGDGSFAAVQYDNVHAGDRIWFDRGRHTDIELLIPELAVGADIPYETLVKFLQTKEDGSVDTGIDVLTEAQYATVGPIKNGYCYKIPIPELSGIKDSTVLFAIFRGVSTDATGGTIFPGTDDLSKITPIEVPASFKPNTVGVLYGQWEFFTMAGYEGKIPDTPEPSDPPSGGGGGSGSGDSGGGISGGGVGDFYQVIFNYNYYGGPVTTETVGKCDITLTVGDASVTITIVSGFYDPMEGYHTDWGYSDRTSVRPGWYFVGWAEQPLVAARELNELLDGNDPEHGGIYYDKEINAYAQNPDRSVTFYGLWVPHHIDWNANGGYFMSIWGAGMQEITTRGHVNEYIESSFKANPVYTSDFDDMAPFIRQPFNTVVPVKSWQDYVTVQFGNRRNPLRTGYRFVGWFYDEWCVVPLDENETGIQPERTYFAGWEPDPVYVRYYDTREGGGLISEVEYKYGDKLTLLDNMKDTDGQGFSRWVVNVNGETRAASSVTDLLNQEKYDPGTHSMSFTDEVLTRYKRTNDGSEEPLSWDEVTMGNKHTAGSIINYDSYWVLDIYTEWNEKTADYTASIDWEDFDNNDGCRPVSVKIGLRSSLNDRTVEEFDMTGSPTAKTWTHTFTGLPITTSDASLEEITYDIYMISFTDIKGNTHEIRDTGATSGEIGVATASEADTAISSIYKYGIDNYMTRGPETRNYAGKITMDYGLITTGTDIKFTMQWDDASNQDGKRPGAVRLVLLADGQPVQVDTNHNSNTGFVDVNPGMCEVSPDGNTWTYTFRDYQKYRDGKAIEYSVAVVNDGTGRYDYASNKFNANGYETIYITDRNADSDPAGAILRRAIEKVNKTISILWHDEQNRDGFRPSPVTVNLYAYQYNSTTGGHDKAFIASAEVAGGMTADAWTYTFTNLDKNNCGQEIIYLAEVGSELNALIPESANKYTWTNQELVITISRLVDTKGVMATVQWNDDNNNDGIRPGSVLLELYADGRPITEAFGIAEADWKVVLSGDPSTDEWTYYYEDMPVFAEGESGRRIVYSLKVVPATESDGLYGTYDEIGVLGEAHTFTRYTATYPREGSAAFTENFAASAQPMVRLTHDKNQIEVPVSIRWQDSLNQDGQRPEYVNLALTAYRWHRDTYKWEYVETATQTVRADAVNTMTGGEWTATFGLQDMYHDGAKVIYHLAVTSDLNEYLPEGSFEYGWTETAHGNQVDAVPQVTISQNINITSTLATIYWDDSQNNDNIRPTNVVLQLYVHAPGEKPVPVKGQAYRVNVTGDPTADNWNHTFSGMPKYAAGQSGVELIYTLRVLEADGEPLYGYYVITANGEEEEVLRYEASYLHEVGGITESTADADQSDRAYVKLTHITETKTMNFSVNWHDGDNRDNVRPSSVPAALYKTVGNGEPIYLRAINITAGKIGTWTQMVTDLPGYEDGESVKHTVQVPEDAQRELAASGYTVMVQDNIIHMTYTPKTGNIAMKLYWSDDDNNDGYRPDSVAAELYANGVATGKTIDLNGTNDWSATWTDLDAHYVDGTATGTDVVYSVRVETPEGYSVAFEPENTTIEANEVLYVRLTHAGDVTDVPVTIYWNDQSDNDHKRPDTLTVQLLADGQEAVGKTLTLNAENADSSGDIWSGTFEDMPVYSGSGEKIYYSLKVYDPTTTTGGYSVMTAGTTLYLSHKPVKSSMYVSFQFDDGFNADGVRPSGLYLQLTANGVPVDDSEYKHTVSFDTNVDGYVWDFGELPVYAAGGMKIAYNVVVTFAPELGATDYAVWTSADIKLSESAAAAANQVIVKLSRSVETTVLDGRIYWFDCNNVAGQRPGSLDLVMRDDADGSSIQYEVNAGTGEVVDRGTRQVVGSVSVAEWTGDSSVWNYTISGVPERYAHKLGTSARIYYYVVANTTSIARYYPTVLTGEDYGMDVALTHKDYETYIVKASQNYTVDIMWLDNSNAWGLRPDSNGVKVDLLANGEVYDTVILTKDNTKDGNPNAWTHTFENIPTYRNGGAIVWSVALPDVDKYIREQTVSTAAASTYRYTQSIGFNLTANWDDSSNDDAVRPESITVGVYGNGTLAGTVTLTGEGNTWTGSTSPLPVWRESDADAAVQYTFLWGEATERYLSEKGYTASPTMGGQPAQSGRFYHLSTEAFGDYEAEGFNALAGTYDWETTLRYQQEKADYHFTATFDDDADRDGVRPETLTVELLADGEVTDTREITVTADESMYDLAWEQLDVNEAGKAIAYTIRLVDKPKGYTVSYNTLNTAVTLAHEPERVTVTGTVHWDDSTQLVDVFNANGTYVRNYEQIARAGVNIRLLADGEPCGEPVYIGKATYGEGEKLESSASTEWPDLYKCRDHGTEIDYTMEVYSDELTALLDDGHSLTYDFGTKYAPRATVTHDLYDIRGTVYYMYSYSEDFLLAGVPVTAYLRGVDGNYKAVGSAVTGEDGTFEILNLPQGLYIIRATYKYGENTLAGTKGLELDRKDASTTVIVDRDAVNDADGYRYTASGAAYCQTDATDAGTIKPVPEGSVVLLYRLDDGQTEPVYVGMATTDGSGRYRFEGLTVADYVVNVVFNYDGGTYTYDNADALADGLSFNVLGADVTWPNIVKQVNGKTDIKDPEKPDEPVVTPPEEPVPCVVSGSVFYADGGVHTTDPVEGVDVYVYLTSNAGVGHTHTDENGRWSVEGLGAADYIAVFSYQGSASRVLLFTVTEDDYETGTYEAAPQYFDRASDTPAGTVRGVVLDEQGRSMRALVGIYNADGTLLDFAYTDTYGNYEFTVAAGYDYNVRFLAVEDEVEHMAAGDPDDELTTLDYYVLSGVFAVDGSAQAGQLVAVYYERGGEYALVTATLTDGDGRFTAKVSDEGNYKVCPYINEKIYETRYVSVGYQEERPSVNIAVNGSYTIAGIEDYDALVLYKIADSVETTVYEESEAGKSTYEIKNLDAGEYRLRLTKDGRETWYYITCPEGTLVDVTYCVTVSGSVLDSDSKAVIGARVELYDADGKQAGEPVTILSDGGYAWHGLPEGKYTVVVTRPHTSGVIADKWTHEPDSYDVAYADGMTGGGTWTWNVNAHVVSGKVTDQKGAPIAGAYVTFESGLDTGAQFVAITGEDGTYSIGLAPGEYSAGAVYYWDTDHAYNATGTICQRVEQDVPDVDFIISRHELTIEAVRMDDGAPAPGAELAVRYEDGTLFWAGKADEDGKAVVTVFPGSYRIFGEYNDSKTISTDVTVTGDSEVVLELDSVVYITGTVRDGSGDAVADGLVYYDNCKGNSGHVYTDDEGHYVIPVASGDLGEYELYAAQGAATSEAVTVSVYTDIELDLTAGGNSEEPIKTHVISGVVSDENGERLPNALVTMVWGNDKTNRATTSTNSLGEYAFTVPDGTYYLTAAYEADNGEVYETNSQSAVHVNGSDEAMDLMVLIGYEVEVTVVDADGNAVAGATVYYEGAASGEAGAGSNGTVSLHLPKGNYQFWAKTESCTSQTVSLTVAGRESLTLVLENAGIFYEEPEVSENKLTIWGYVYAPDGEPVQGADVALYRQDLETLEWDLVDSTGTDTDGRYEFSDLEDGTYRVDTVHTYTAEAETANDGWVVSGTVTDDAGDPLSYCRVELWTEAGDLIAEVTTGEDGKYIFEGVDPDESYVVKAWDASEEPVMDGPAEVTATSAVISGTVLDVAGHIVPNAEIVILDAEGNTVATTVSDETGYYSVAVDGQADRYQVVMELPASYEVDTESYERDTTDRNAPYLEPSWYTIEGYVHDIDGKPVEGAEVILTRENGEEVDRYVTGADGYYIFDHLADGVYHVHVVYRDQERDYTVEAGDQSNNIGVTITNYSNGTVTAPEGGWYDGWNSFMVECNLACLVYIKDTNGGMTKLEAEATGENNVYRFTASLSEGDEIIALVRGDVDLDGRLTAADLVRLSRYFGGANELDEYADLAADVDQDGRLTAAGLVRLSQYFGGMYKLLWNPAE